MAEKYLSYISVMNSSIYLSIDPFLLLDFVFVWFCKFEDIYMKWIPNQYFILQSLAKIKKVS